MIVIAGETANTNFTRAYSLEELMLAGAFVSGPSYTRLVNLGLDPGKVRSLNLCSPGRWDPAEAVANASRLINRLADELKESPDHDVCKILAMGQRASFSFGLPFMPLASKRVWWRSLPMKAVYVVSCPHPSGLSRWWNNPNNVRAFKEMVYGLQ